MRPGDSPDPDRVVRGQFGSQDIEVPDEIPIDGPEALAWDAERRRAEAEAARIVSPSRRRGAGSCRGARREILNRLADVPQPGPSSRLFDSPAKTRPLAEVAATPVPWGRVRGAVEKALEGRTCRRREARPQSREPHGDEAHQEAARRLGSTCRPTKAARSSGCTTWRWRSRRPAASAPRTSSRGPAPRWTACCSRPRRSTPPPSAQSGPLPKSGAALSTWAPRSGLARAGGLGSLAGAFSNPSLLFMAGATSPFSPRTTRRPSIPATPATL